MPWSSAEIVSPHDAQARFSHKPGKVEWVGYKDHQTETCDEQDPHLIVHVVTTPAPEQDIGVIDAIHTALAKRQLAPAEHLLDSGYVTPETVHRASAAHGITIVGPVRQDPRAIERPGFTKEDFYVDWQARTVTCPQGAASPQWKPTMADRKPRLSVLFRRADCRNCTVRQDCTGNVEGKGRHLLLLPQPLQEIQTLARAQQQTPEWKKRYALRAGAEATVSETVHAHGLRHCRYRGLAERPQNPGPTADTGLPPGIGAPATRALIAAGYTHLTQLAGVPVSDLKRLHGWDRKRWRGYRKPSHTTASRWADMILVGCSVLGCRNRRCRA